MPMGPSEHLVRPLGREPDVKVDDDGKQDDDLEKKKIAASLGAEAVTKAREASGQRPSKDASADESLVECGTVIAGLLYLVLTGKR